MILICIFSLLILPGCSKEPENISITDYEWLFSNYMCSDNGTFYCTLPVSKNRPNSVPAEVTLSPATETAISLLNTELGCEILLIDQQTGERYIYIYGLTLTETSAEKTVYSVTTGADSGITGQAVVSKEAKNSAMLILTSSNGIFTFYSP
ncbi:MAG: hypothetical protein IJX14_01505 [Clostridia bacterium]|nr:hypothetical protein [Clostridia bacterium]